MKKPVCRQEDVKKSCQKPMWRFPGIGVPPNSQNIYFYRIFPYKPSIFRKPPCLRCTPLGMFPGCDNWPMAGRFSVAALELSAQPKCLRASHCVCHAGLIGRGMRYLPWWVVPGRIFDDFCYVNSGNEWQSTSIWSFLAGQIF